MKSPLILGTSKIGSRGQVTIPKRAREEFGLKPGGMVLFVAENKKLILRKDIES